MKAAMWFLLVLLSICGHCVTALSPYNITLNDESPAIKYSPSRSGPSAGGWNVSYTGSPYSTYVLDSTIGLGDSSHFTTRVGSTAAVGWVGTAAYVWGTSTNGATSITLDGIVLQSVVVGTGMIAKVAGLSYGWHELVVTVTGNQGVTIKGMTLTTAVGKNGSVLSNSTLPALTPGGTSNPSFDLKGAWTAQSVLGSQSYNRLEAAPYASMSFLTVPNASHILIYALNNYDHGDYSINISPPPGTVATSIPANQTFNSNSTFIALDTVAFYSSLDPAVQYNITYSNGPALMALTSVVFTIAAGGSDGSTTAPVTSAAKTISGIESATGSSTSGSTTSVPIAAIVVPIVAVLIIAAGLAFWYFRRRQNRVGAGGKKEFVVDEYRETTERDPGLHPAGAAFKATPGEHDGPATAALVPPLNLVPLGASTPNLQERYDPFRTPGSDNRSAGSQPSSSTSEHPSRLTETALPYLSSNEPPLAFPSFHVPPPPPSTATSYGGRSHHSPSASGDHEYTSPGGYQSGGQEHPLPPVPEQYQNRNQSQSQSQSPPQSHSGSRPQRLSTIVRETKSSAGPGSVPSAVGSDDGQSHPVQEEDAGPIPPGYDPSWAASRGH